MLLMSPLNGLRLERGPSEGRAYGDYSKKRVVCARKLLRRAEGADAGAESLPLDTPLFSESALQNHFFQRR